ncbi:phosphoglycolate phosphatase [Methylohalomonas lacus]|uniref:Phosphoglycolate phosphatase n=1 Tax=Methylohalomonas lacus TaxID=398773 RepID=A0AAE3HJW9_9GAMM|nr:HAD-IA family hydrolase [Methylohalomonas lacus]MCS3902429.1 phosphoglycolate phosphatase [Methylohalomonas lacus]
MTVRNLQLDGVLFDLDGTLVDTAPGLAAALNSLCQLKGRAPPDYTAVRPIVSQGGAALIALAFADCDSAEREQLRREFLDIYARLLNEQPGASPLFAGMAGLLDNIEARGWRWGIVTNKPLWLSEPLLAAIGLDRRSACLVCGDQVQQPKPAPEALLLACEQLGCAPARAVYIGDAQRDIAAGQAAGLYTLAAAYGYLARDEDPTDWGADAIVSSVADIDAWLQTHAHGG